MMCMQKCAAKLNPTHADGHIAGEHGIFTFLEDVREAQEQLLLRSALATVHGHQMHVGRQWRGEACSG